MFPSGAADALSAVGMSGITEAVGRLDRKQYVTCFDMPLSPRALSWEMSSKHVIISHRHHGIAFLDKGIDRMPRRHV